MSEIIDSTYEIIGKLGAGGGGVVYLANHIRLGKRVVLKADKRSTNTRQTLLRREVDVLKELRHTYIPQVYDYFIEDDTSYTVMDFVDGESLDKILKRENKIPQAKTIFWIRQLLEALAYLHSPTHGDPPRGYVHSDVKPANIMIRPDGNICLIDFNISLAIGIETVIGKSDGYSSPEHYGIDYSFGGSGTNYKKEKNLLKDNEVTELADNEKTVLASEINIAESSGVNSSYSSSVKKVIVPDARSDIYSVGATMYHMLSGRKPVRDAKDVEPLSYKEISPLIVDIVTKAMDPNPDLRFGAAEEMLEAINGLWKNDPRVRRRKKQLAAAAAIFSVMAVIGGAAVFTGIKQTERLQAAHVLAADSAEALSGGNVRSALDLAMQALKDDPGTFDIPYTAEAQFALTNALGVYDLSDSFKPHSVIELPSAPFRIKLSPDGKKLFICYAYELAIYDIETGNAVKTLPTLESALCEAEFIDNDRIIYAGEDGLTAYDFQNDRILWQTAPATAISVSGDGSTAAAINGKDDLINFYDTETGELVSYRELEGRHMSIPENDNFADAERNVLELNEDGSLCAVSLEGGFLGMLDIYDPDGDMIIYDTSEYAAFGGVFCDDLFTFSAFGGADPIFGMADFKTAEYIGDLTENDPVELKVYNGELYITRNDTVLKVETDTLEQIEAAYMENKNITAFDVSDKYVICAAEDGYSIFYKNAGLMTETKRDTRPDIVLITDEYAVIADKNSPTVEILKMQEHDEKCIIEYDPGIYHSEARLLADRSGVFLFSINSIAFVNADGSVKMTADLPDPDKIYDQQYLHESDELEVTYYSGKVKRYSARTGKIVSESESPPPDDSLDEEFETENYIIKAPLHGTPEVYSKADGEKIADLNSEDYLTYITESGNYIIAQYISTDGTFYGILMNSNCESLAKIPYLCDIVDDMLVSDYPAGKIKLSPVYELDELKEQAKNYRN